MDLSLKWHEHLTIQSTITGIYDVDALDKIPNTPGIYIFLRVHGKKHEALYVGKAISLKSRIKQQLNNLKLMKGIESAAQGKRLLVFAEFKAKRGQQVKKLLSIEHALIRHYLALGNPLLNVKGARIVKNSVMSERTEMKQFIPGTLYFEDK
jgi:hypothetical protein